MSSNLDTVGEYVYLQGPPVVLTVRSSCFVSLALLSQYSELDCEENKLEVRLFDKQ